MSKVFARIVSYFSSRSQVGVDKVGNRYFTRTEEIDGIMKEKRWVIFKGEDDPTSIPVEWISWLNGQRKKAPTLEEMIELEAKRERVRQNVALLKKEEEEKKAKQGHSLKGINSDKIRGPDLGSFIRQFPPASEGDKVEEASDSISGQRKPSHRESTKEKLVPESSEPIGSGQSYRPGTWQPPT